MANRCRQCGRPLGADEYREFCSSGCEHAFERENPGVLAQEHQEAMQRLKIGLPIAVVVGIIIYLINSCGKA